MAGYTLSEQAVREIKQLFAAWSKELRPPSAPVQIMPPRRPGGSNCYKVAVKNDEDYPHGLYERTQCGEEEVWELLIAFTEGHCPYSEDDPDGVGCDPEGYDPGEGWTETTAEGYDAAWENEVAGEPPAETESCGWEDASYTVPAEGGGWDVHFVWRCLDCHWIAYGQVVHLAPG